MTAPSQTSRSEGTLGRVVGSCQLCGSGDLESLLFLGYVPPLNALYPTASRPGEEACCPAEALVCRKCQLVQLGFVLHEHVLFPPDYPYVSGTTRVQRENFADLYRQSAGLTALGSGDLVVDIGSNNGTLLAEFQSAGHRVLGVEPTRAGDLALGKGIPTVRSFLRPATARSIVAEHGRARVVTATNILAHVGDVHELLSGIDTLVADDGVLLAEVQDLRGVVEQLQYDSFYHEHIRYYSLATLSSLLAQHGLHVFAAKRIATHGGSLRILAGRAGVHPMDPDLSRLSREEASIIGTVDALREFARKAMLAKLELMSLLVDIKRRGERLFAVGAASRSSMLVHYVGLDAQIIECALEMPGSPKIGTYLPGTLIPIVDEARLWEEQPDHALLLSWHVAADLMPKLAARGFRGGFIVPLPEPRIIPKAP